MKRMCMLLYALIVFSVLGLAQTDSSSLNASGGISEFPNYHPLVVHFPLVLLIVAACMQAGLLFLQNRAYNYAVTLITVVGFLTGLLAATVFHAHPAHNINPVAHQIFEEHETFAFITLWLSGMAAIIKIAGMFIRKRWIEVAALVFLIGSGVSVSIAGHHGSELVYKQGVGPLGNKLEEEHE